MWQLTNHQLSGPNLPTNIASHTTNITFAGPNRYVIRAPHCRFKSPYCLLRPPTPFPPIRSPTPLLRAAEHLVLASFDREQEVLIARCNKIGFAKIYITSPTPPPHHVFHITMEPRGSSYASTRFRWRVV